MQAIYEETTNGIGYRERIMRIKRNTPFPKQNFHGGEQSDNHMLLQDLLLIKSPPC